MASYDVNNNTIHQTYDYISQIYSTNPSKIIPPSVPISSNINNNNKLNINYDGTNINEIRNVDYLRDNQIKKGIRRNPINDISIEPAENNILSELHIPKTKENIMIISHALKKHFLFQSLDISEINNIIGVMTKSNHKTGEEIIQQNTPGSRFYVLENGYCDIIINNKIIGKYQSGDAFGELALLYNCPRAATIICTSDCILWSLDRMTFRTILATTASTVQMARLDFLKQVQLFELLSTNQLQKLASVLKLKEYKQNDYIIRQGEEGSTFYIILEGQVRCSSGLNINEEKNLMILNKGDYFGEMALLLNEPRQANCIANSTSVYCLELDRSNFIELLGPLQPLLDRQMRIRVLRSVPLLKSLSDDELDIIAHALRVTHFEDNEYIIKEGNHMDNIFYIISEGKVSVKKKNIELMILQNGEFFGERALLYKEPRAADCVAIGKVECLSLDRESFEKLLGKLEHIMEREIKKQERMQDIVFEKYFKKQKEQIYQLELGQDYEKECEQKIKNKNNHVYDKIHDSNNKYLNNNKKKNHILLNELEKIRTIGTGTFGRVFLVKNKKTNQTYALKCMQKATIVSSQQQKNVILERNIISNCEHPFILKLYETYSDADQLYMLLELVQGGELWSLLYEKSHYLPKSIHGSGFSLNVTQFYASNIVDALYYLHQNGVAYRDLKPENLILDKEGYLKMVDFGFAKHIPYYDRKNEINHKSFTLCGTPEYLAPELVLSKGHNKSVDHWALGCLIYELIVGKTPFQHDDQNKIFENIINVKYSLKFANNFDSKAKNLITRLLHPNPALRLGSLVGGVKEIMEHSWFQDIDWYKLRTKQIIAPYIPKVENALDSQNFEHYAEDDQIVKYVGPDYFIDF